MSIFTAEEEEEGINIESDFSTLDKLNEGIKDYNWLILTVNIRRLGVNAALLETYIAGLSNKPQIIVCSETWVIENPSVFSIENYILYYNKGNINSADGVAIYVRSDVAHKTNIIEYDLFKVLNCKIFLDGNESLLITAIYRCHDYSKTDFIGVMKKIIDNKERNHIVAGDFNINILKNEPESEELLNECFSGGYLPLFNSITRPNEQGGTCILTTFMPKLILTLKLLNTHKCLQITILFIVVLVLINPLQIMQVSFID